ncbi:DUF4158 domain-containing protein [Nonomuraea sp. 3N208]|uniref:DUF4158 domain-containing protein n=1 Tax=Nonomuraea sp. 3N208 TaxID=3457421 RepID=UPI003FCF4D3E
MTSIDRTAYPRFGRMMSARELTETFTPTDDEASWARGRTQDEQHLLALLVWLKSYQRLGYFPKLDQVPSVAATHVRGILELPESVELEQAAERSAKRHRQFVRERLGVVYEPARVREVAEKAIRKAAQTKDNPADLINVALEELVRARCELPGYSTLDAMTATIRTEINTGLFAMVAGRVDGAARARLSRLLLVDPVSRRSEFDKLKEVAQAASLTKFKTRLKFLRHLDALGPTEDWLEGVPPGKVAHFAGEAKVTDVADLRKVLSEDKRLTLIISLLHTVRTSTRDEVVTMFCKRMAAIHKKGRDQLEALREAHRAESERLLGVFGERSVLDAVEFLRAHRNSRSAYLAETVTVEESDPDGEVSERTLVIEVEAFTSQAWRKILRDTKRPGLLVRRHLEVCVFSYLAAELRSGDIAVIGSDSYANLHAQLMSWEECEPHVAAFCEQAGIPAEATALTEHYRGKLSAIAAEVDAGYPGSTDLTFNWVINLTPPDQAPTTRLDLEPRVLFPAGPA